MGELTGAKRRLLERLQRVDAASASELAAHFGLTDTAVRQHLEAMERAGLVERASAATAAPIGRGRPAARWRLAASAATAFADRHVDLTVDLIESTRVELGEEALERVIDARARRQAHQYRAVVGSGSVAVRVRRLAEQRTREGYEAEAVPDGGDLVLVEHHCPICTAAQACTSLCRSELDVFRAVLGPAVRVEREQHLLAGDRRCAYRISAA